MSKFAETLLRLTKEKNLNTTKLKKALGISKTQTAKYLNGIYEPSLKNALKICELFNCSMDFMLGFDDIPNRFGELQEPSFDKFIARYKELLKINNTNHSKVSKQAQFNRNNLIYWEKNKCLPTLDILSKLSECLKTPVEYLIGRTDSRDEIVRI